MIEPMKRQRGFSLAEVLVAVALLSVILLALFGLVSGGMQRAYSGKKMTEATNLAQTVLEQANTVGPHTVIGAGSARTSAKITLTKTGGIVTAATQFLGGDPLVLNTYPTATTNGWITLLQTSDLPTSGGPIILTVTETPQPSGDFGTAALVRIVVDLQWNEWGTRDRQVRLEALTIRTTTPTYL